MKKWSADNPKAALMETKRAAIVAAARESFLQNGYSQASMDGIAGAAGVSVKTIYGHFKDKKELFSAVMQAVCRSQGAPQRPQDEAAIPARFPWFTDATQQGLVEAGKEYLRHLLAPEQLALYRVVKGAMFHHLILYRVYFFRGARDHESQQSVPEDHY